MWVVAFWLVVLAATLVMAAIDGIRRWFRNLWP